MADLERSEEQSPAGDPWKPLEVLAIIATPFEGEQPVEHRTPDGGFTIFLRGEITIAYRPPANEASESPVSASETPTNSLVPEHTSSPVREPHSGPDVPLQTASTPEASAEDENRKFELVGNPVRDPSYRVRRSGKRIADFVLATHPTAEETEYWRIRAFDKQAERVRDQVRKGQTGVEVTAYGPKHWKSRKKTNGGYEETTVTGYYAGFVKVPKRYREQGNRSEAQKPTE